METEQEAKYDAVITEIGRNQMIDSREIFKIKNVMAELAKTNHDLKLKIEEIQRDLNELRPRVNELESYQV